MKLVGRLPCAIFVRKINILKRWSGVTTIRNPSLDIKCTKKVVSANPQTGSCCLQNRFLPIPKPVFADLETGFSDYINSFSRFNTGFCRLQNCFLPISKPVFLDSKTGFWQPQNCFLPTPNRVLPISKLVFADFKTGICWLLNRLFRSEMRFLPTPKPVLKTAKTGFCRSKDRFLLISKPVFFLS